MLMRACSVILEMFSLWILVLSIMFWGSVMPTVFFLAFTFTRVDCSLSLEWFSLLIFMPIYLSVAAQEKRRLDNTLKLILTLQHQLESLFMIFCGEERF